MAHPVLFAVGAPAVILAVTAVVAEGESSNVAAILGAAAGLIAAIAAAFVLIWNTVKRIETRAVATEAKVDLVVVKQDAQTGALTAIETSVNADTVAQITAAVLTQMQGQLTAFRAGLTARDKANGIREEPKP